VATILDPQILAVELRVYLANFSQPIHYNNIIKQSIYLTEDIKRRTKCAVVDKNPENK
jgi:hypothetical protein